MEDYIIEPQSVQFLVQHGFDFNKQYSQGIPYYKGNDKGDERHLQSVRTLFLELLRAKKPLILHNGLIDLAFLYQCFYAHLPDSLGNFIADLSEMFPAGIYDTKYASEFEIRFTASYLEYAYKKCKRENYKLMDSSAKHLAVDFCSYPTTLSAYVDYRHCSLPDPNQDNCKTASLHICKKFSAYGWCPNGQKCTQSHDIDLIIDEDEKLKDDKRKKRNKRKRRKNAVELPKDCDMAADVEPPCKQPCGSPQQAGVYQQYETNKETQDEKSNNADCEMQEELKGSATSQHVEKTKVGQEKESPDVRHLGGGSIGTQPDCAEMTSDGSDTKVLAGRSPQPPAPTGGKQVQSSESGTHRAGFDAFMTGYIMGYIWMLKKGAESSAADCLSDCHNKVYLSGKNIPLQIVKSVFSKSSKAHTQKLRLISVNGS
ncbi:target of EGR1 protein 1 isoform X2 [Spea bombifrons]|nr:target of EGR1 protein 1 isoform X2 [Spea bombifrons]